ncbi:MAG: DUF4349 domain-containing protein [Candidatus Shapirobacteria bacterium]
MSININKVWKFVKKHWLVIILGIFTIKYFSANYFGYSIKTASPSVGQYAYDSYSGSKSLNIPLSPGQSRELAPTSDTSRLVIRDTSLSLQVKNVNDVISRIQALAESSGGFLVAYNLSSPESAASGNISVRVPSSLRSQLITQIQALGVKTVSLSVNGQDVTDQFVDNEARLKVLYSTQTKFNQIMDQAVRVADLLEVQRELINLQTQIDSLKGQQQYLEKSAELSLISVYLSTDELSLPYTPTNTWRPMVIFREAVRSFIASTRTIVSALIWLAVYSPLILIVLIVAWWLQRRSVRVK